MKINILTISIIEEIQKNNPDFLLCGSIALILKGLLPNRDVSDIDFVTNHRFAIESNLKLNSTRAYGGFYGGDRHTSLMCSYSPLNIKVNILAFPDDVEFQTENLNILNITNIKCQNFQDIVNWKEKYNRSKDQIDLDKLHIKLIEDALHEENT